MITYKKIDISVQVILFLGWIAGAIISSDLLLFGFDFSYFLFGLGAVQLTSAFVHFFFGREIWGSVPRIIYYVLVIIAFSLMAIALTSNNLDTSITIGFILAIGTSMIALYYILISSSELKRLRKQS